MAAGDLHAQSFGLEPIAVAGLARYVGEIARDLLAGPLAVGFAEAAFEVGDHAFERPLGLVGARAVVVGEADLGVAGAVENGVLGLLRQVFPLGVERELVMLAQRGQRLHVIRRRRFRPRRDRALAQGALLVGNDQFGIDVLLDAKPAAFRAGAERIVEREQPRLDLGNGEAGHRAGEFFREHDALGGIVPLPIGFCSLGLLPSPLWGGVGGGGRAASRRRRASLIASRLPTGGRRSIGELRHRKPVGELERLFERIRQPRGNIRPHHQAIHHDVDVVGEFLVECRHVGDLVEIAVDFDALKTLAHELGEFLAVLALPAAHHGREQIKPRAFRQRHDAIDHLRDGLALDRQPGRRRIGHADAGPQKPHVIVDLGDRADGRARIARGSFLLDGDGRRQAVDLIDVRLLHHFQELARVSRQAFDVAALALGINGVEGERGFAGAGQAGEHHQPVARNIEVDVFEIVLAGAANGDQAAVAQAASLPAGILLRAVEQIVHSCTRSSPPQRGPRLWVRLS